LLIFFGNCELNHIEPLGNCELRDEFRIFADENDFPEEFIDTPEWAIIMDMAKDVLKAFNYSKI
jgi:hypothetical protein